MAKTYYEKLRDPRWQKKRLQIMERANFACENCGDTKSTLNVHHGYYTKGMEPWEYANDTLHCLCESCHEKAEELRHDIDITLARISIDTNTRILYLINVLANMTDEQLDELYQIANDTYGEKIQID